MVTSDVLVLIADVEVRFTGELFCREENINPNDEYTKHGFGSQLLGV